MRGLLLLLVTISVGACGLLTGVHDLRIEEEGDAAPPVEGSTEPPEAGVIGFGDGRDGDFDVTGDTVTNAYVPLRADAPAGADAVEVEDPSAFQEGVVALIWQVTGQEMPPVGVPLLLPSGSVGRWELVRVRSTGSTRINFDRPLSFSYAATAAQIVRVPQFRRVTVRSGQALRALPWDGRVGGILAILASDDLVVDGVLTADGAGFRGGAGLANAGFGGCPPNDGLPRDGYAAKDDPVPLPQGGQGPARTAIARNAASRSRITATTATRPSARIGASSV